ncbi:MAG: hypothetical protein HQK97_04030 [Nitrospirae bacterium]|nr:hypothetical protein [Nitrospirota bacterium]
MKLLIKSRAVLVVVFLSVMLCGCRGTINSYDTIQDQIRQQYKVSAEADTPRYYYEVLAGAGFQGNRDGRGVYALFNNPTDIVFSDETEFLYVLDNGNRSVRRVNIETKETSTVLDYSGFMKYDFRRLLVFKEFIILQANHQIIKLDRHAVKDLSSDKNVILDLGNEEISDIKKYGGDILCLTNNKVLRYSSSLKQWYPLPLALSTQYDYLFLDKDKLYIVSTSASDCVLYDIAIGKVIKQFKFDRIVNHLIKDSIYDRYILVCEGAFYAAEADPEKMAKTYPLHFTNIHGHSIGNDNASFEYRQAFYSNIDAIVNQEEAAVFYVLDRENHRIIKMRNNLNSWIDPIAEAALLKEAAFMPPEEGYINPIYTKRKPYGVNRIMWLSHSVYWNPAGANYSNLPEFSAPVQLSAILNAKRDLSGYWEIMRPLMTGCEMYHRLYDNFEKAVNQYAADYVFVVLDLNAFYWMTSNWHGWMRPALRAAAPHDATGYPIPEDGKFDEVDEFIRSSIKNDTQSPFFNKDGSLADNQFMRLWMTRADFRKLLINRFMDIFSRIKTACDNNGIELVVFLSPSFNFFSSAEYNTTQGGSEKAYNVEDAHNDILSALYYRNIKAYDISYEMIRRFIKYFPYNAHSHHRSYLFQQAVAESIDEVLQRYDVISKTPLPAKQPIGQKQKNSAAH